MHKNDVAIFLFVVSLLKVYLKKNQPELEMVK